MLTPLVVPKIGMSTAGYTVVQWLKNDGGEVRPGEAVVVIETAKVAEEVESPAAGLLFRLKQAGDEVRPGDELGVVADSAEEFEGHLASGRKKEEGGGFFDETEEDQGGVGLSFADEPDAPVPALSAAGGTSPPPPAPPLPEVDDEAVLKRLPHTGMRRAIADNLWTSLQTGAQLTVVARTDVTDLNRYRQELRLDTGRKITFVDMLVKLLAVALREFPILNSSIVGDEIICWREINIGVAVALEDGLVVPVIRGADRKSLPALSREIKKLSGLARQGELNPEDYQGGTFTLSSGGKIEVDFMTPIINPPQNAILGLGRIAPQPAVYRDRPAVRTMTHLCLTHDHRAVDGLPAGLFLTRLKQIMEQPPLFRKILR